MSGPRIHVGIAELEVARAPVLLHAVALGSCVAIILHDPVARLGGLAHVLLPSPNVGRQRPEQPGRTATTAVTALLEGVLALGAVRSRLTARLVGGARMFGALLPEGSTQMGERNLAAAREALRQQQLPVIGEAVGGDYGRSVEFDLATGRVIVSSHRMGAQEL